MGELDWFAYDVHFAPVLVRGGFSVVVGNPPWVRHSRIEPAARKMYADRFALFRRRGGSGFHQPDLALAFVERGADLAEAGGVVALLLPAKVANARYASAFRNFIDRETTLIEIHDWTEEGRRWFDADTFPLAVTFRKAAPLDGSCSDIRIGSESFAMTQRMLRASSGSEWRLLQPAIHAVIDRIIRQHPSLEHALGRAPFMGVKTGNNDLLFLDGATLRNDELVTSEGIAIPLTWICRCVRGRDVQRWAATDSQWMLWPPVAGWRNPPAWASRLADARGVDVESMRLAYVKP
jgi:hypothetical protein